MLRSLASNIKKHGSGDGTRRYISKKLWEYITEFHLAEIHTTNTRQLVRMVHHYQLHRITHSCNTVTMCQKSILNYYKQQNFRKCDLIKNPIDFEELADENSEILNLASRKGKVLCTFIERTLRLSYQ